MELLEEREKTIYWLAKQVGEDFSTLYRIRDGKAAGIRFDLLGRMCEALECQPGDLLRLVRGTRGKTKRRA
jgi:putative transcriptional regulator